jgi:hypothetical protein
MKYEACFRNLTFKQAQAMYRVAVDLADDEHMYGNEGLTWSGLIPGNRSNAGRARGSAHDAENHRTITIQPMVGEQNVL